MGHQGRAKLKRWDKERSNQKSLSGLTKEKECYPEAIGSHCKIAVTLFLIYIGRMNSKKGWRLGEHSRKEDFKTV